MKGEMRMDLGVTDQLSWRELAGLYRSKGISDVIRGMSFAELAAARASEGKGKQPDGTEGKTGSYMGESYRSA